MAFTALTSCSCLVSTGWTQEHKYVPFACWTGYLGGQEIFVAVLVFNSELTGDDENTILNDPHPCKFANPQ